MTYDPDQDTRAPRSDRRAPGPPLDPAGGIGSIWTAVVLLALLFVGGFAWIYISGDLNVASNDRPAAQSPATTGSGSNSSN